MTAESLTWTVARAGGLVAYLLLTASVGLGLLLSLGWRTPLWRRFVTNEVHRFVTLLALVLTGIHTLAVALDPFIGFTPTEVLVPFVSHYRPLWVALGIVGAYLLVAVWLSEYIRPRVGYAAWRRFHALAFVVYALSTVHGLATGSDTRAAWAIALYGGSVALVGALVAARLFPPAPARTRPIVAVAGLSLVVVGWLWAWQGPLQPGWNAIANDGRGSGSALTAAVTGDPATPTPTPAGPFDGAFQTSLSGTVTQEVSGDLRVDARLDSPARATLTLVLTEGNSSTVRVAGPNGSLCGGTVQWAADGRVQGACADASGRQWLLGLRLRAENGEVRGTLRVTPTGEG